MARLVNFDPLRGLIGGVVDDVKSMSSDTSQIELHAAHLDSIDRRLDRIVVLMEQMTNSIDELRATVEQVQGSVEPVGRLAERFPGRAKR